MYRYKAVNPAGEIEHGEIDAAGGEAAAVAKLQNAGYLPIRVQSAELDTRWSWRALKVPILRREVSPRDIEFFTRELATLLRAGLPLDQSLQTLIDVTDNAAFKRLVLAVDEEVRQGSTLSAALANQRTGMPDLLINMVRAGEASGSLDTGLARLADYLERSRDLRESITSALLYPVILLVVAGLSVTALMVFVLPQFSQMFADLGATPPWATRFVLGVAEVLRSYWWMGLCVVLAASFLGQRWLSDPAHRLKADALMLQMPLIGELITKTELARFTHTLGTLIGHGVPLVKSLDIVCAGTHNRALRQSVAEATQGLQKGRGLSAPLSDGGLFPPLAIKLIRIGEESGRLEEMLLRLAEVYEREVRTTVQRLLGLLEPVLIVGFGAVIGAIMLAVLSAVIGINQSVI
jgi:general secretion pathway protein F